MQETLCVANHLVDQFTQDVPSVKQIYKKSDNAGKNEITIIIVIVKKKKTCNLIVF